MITRGRAVRSRRRDAVVGSAVATAAVAALALVFLPGTSGTPVQPGPSLLPPATTTTAVGTTPRGVPGSHEDNPVTTTTGQPITTTNTTR
ncbi:hypothetical protein SAMN05216188_106340 [Lentzea xinjiangensis]|uniref:Uncharacterized protein n=1 Tax=Lentzea xinjiangensis TaxID=402600 RepID=A0A1H9K845_9PSEU|nr:hypothetical protein [Lentzea xinjiangensis]SEQ95301.1 hypothetical protein SAMN05216188_106340 [Lentzea xinjiangensis]